MYQVTVVADAHADVDELPDKFANILQAALIRRRSNAILVNMGPSSTRIWLGPLGRSRASIPAARHQIAIPPNLQ